MPRLDRDAWSIVERQRQATNEYAAPPAALSLENKVAFSDFFLLRIPLELHGRNVGSYRTC